MKVPGWVLALVGVPLLGAGGLGALVFFASQNWPGLAASVLALGSGMACFIAASRPSASAPSLELPASHPARHAQQSLASPVARGGPSAALQVPVTVRLGGELPVRAMLFLPTKLELNPHRQRLRFVIEEHWESALDEPVPSAVVHEEVFSVNAPADTVGAWEVSWTPRVPPNAPPSYDGQWFRLRAWVEFSVPHGMFGELSAKQPVVILPERES